MLMRYLYFKFRIIIIIFTHILYIIKTLFILILNTDIIVDTAKPVGSACIGEHHSATNVSRIIATLLPKDKSLHRYMVFGTSRHRYIDTLFCNDVTRYMYRDKMRYINMPNLLVLLYIVTKISINLIDTILSIKLIDSFLSISRYYRDPALI